jgi:putative membrane protein
MTSPQETKPKAALSDYLAAERTLLAWIRTGLALMGFGFVVARFGLFLRQLQWARGGPSAEPYTQSLWFGTALIVVGVLVNILAGYHHAQLVRSLDRGESAYRHSTRSAIAVAFLLAVVGIGMAIYLVTIRG